MKKIYSTMLLALAVAGIAYAGNPLASNSEKYSFAASNQVAGNAMIAPTAIANATLAKAPASRAGETATIADIAGSYMFTVIERDFNTNQQVMNDRTIAYVQPQADGKHVTIEGFYFSDLTVDGIFDEATQTITIPAGQDVVVKSQDNQGNIKELHVTPYEFLFDNESAADIVLEVDAATRSLVYIGKDDGTYYTSCMLIGEFGAAPGKNIYCQVYQVAMHQINSLVTYILPGQKPDLSDAQNISEFIYAQLNQKGDLEINGFFGAWDMTITMTIDKEAKTATSTDQVVFYDQNNFGVKTNFYLQSFIDDTNRSNTIVFPITVEQKTEGGYTYPVSHLTSVDAAIATDPSVQQAKGTSIFDLDFQLLEIDLLGNGEGSVEGIISDNYADAPVEYFNLQGVRVANPEAGQLVIKRQGSTVTKIVVR